MEAMIVVDTNILVRFIVNDGPTQSERVFRLFDEREVRVIATVLLECEWVLRSFYKFPSERVCEAFRLLLRMDSVFWDDVTAVVSAVAWHAAGMEFADALHLAQTRSEQTFATFYGDLAKHARRNTASARIEIL
jgi:predicted nucleic-acid-binding protein